jgi:hypothetical protein
LTGQPLHQGIRSSDKIKILDTPPQKVNFAIQIISGIFPGEGIIVEHGKVSTNSILATKKAGQMVSLSKQICNLSRTAELAEILLPYVPLLMHIFS